VIGVGTLPDNKLVLGLAASLAVHSALMTANLANAPARPEANTVLAVNISKVNEPAPAPPVHAAPQAPPANRAQPPTPSAADASPTVEAVKLNNVPPTAAPPIPRHGPAARKPAATPVRQSTEASAKPITTPAHTAAWANQPQDNVPQQQAAIASARSARNESRSRQLAELNHLLHSAIDRCKRYPLSALRLGREGTARINFRLFRDGRIDMLGLSRSSGFHALDRAALAAVQSIEPFTQASHYIPDSERFEVDVVFRYN